MSIKEALGRAPVEKQVGLHIDRGWVDRKERKAVFAKVDLLLDKAHIPQLLLELTEIIKPDYPDVEITERTFFVGGYVSTGLEWNSIRLSEEGRPLKYQYNNLKIDVFPTRDEIAIGGEILTKEEWERQDVVEDAMVVAYKNPQLWVGPPSHI